MEREDTEKSPTALREERILNFWKEKGIFQKTLDKEAPNGEFVFYEGPPTANAKPALHHLEARAFKDVIPRYKTMQGYRVPRRAGWDTHGLPVELQIEKKLGLSSKKDIEAYGIAQFNKECKDSVFTYIKDWETFTDRIGYWVDKNDAYYTFDTDYIAALWNIVSTINDKGLLYKDYKVVPWCPRCGTVLSSHELAQGYQDDKDLSVYAKFKIKGVENGYFLAWTTTPWTLPGNVALTVGKDIDYVEAKVGEDIVVLAKERVEILPEGYEIVAEHKGSEMVGMEYEPLYPYIAELDKGDKKLQNAYKVYVADFVTTTDGTGIVHTAVMYGADDFVLGTTVGLPKFHTVDEQGHFIPGTGFLEGRFVKDEEVAVDIIKDLAHRRLLFKKEKYEHSYPHCWRCKTPLIYYARDSWYIGMSELRDELVKENDGINWEPPHIKEGRFGEWLREVKDWAISRERYWGTPLPIWTTDDGEKVVVGSIHTLKKLIKKSGNTYFVMRHGETENNVKMLWSCDSAATDILTEKGRTQIGEAVDKLGKEQIDLIITSPFSRTRQTAELVAETLGYARTDIILDHRLGEWQPGTDWNNKSIEEYFLLRNASPDRYQFTAPGGESYADILKRSSEFLYDIESRYAGKNILIISHGAPCRAIEYATEGFTFDKLFERTRDYRNFDNGEIRKIDFAPLPHNEKYELDLHKPYIDQVELQTQDGKKLTRVKEVMDVWFDSGSMPFASQQSNPYPADFISEAIDQTRGWFYTLHAIGVLMGRGRAYKNVICLGHLLDKDGKKMSKSIGNIVEPFEQMDKFGVDAVRYWMYSVNQPGESKNYDEKSVAEINNKVFNLVYNVLSFYDLYRDRNLEVQPPSPSEHVLDQWIMARLNQLIEGMTKDLDSYDLFRPTRDLRDFIDDLSTWYLRRSRDRIKDNDPQSKQTLYKVMKILAQLIAPFAPFTAEDIWQKLRHQIEEESVHLSVWPIAGSVDAGILQSMEVTRNICTLGNAERKKTNIPVRQPLGVLQVKNMKLASEYVELIKDELNVKSVVEDEAIATDAVFDTTITPELKAEGEYRELVRVVQDMRKERGLEPQDAITLTLPLNYQPIVNVFGEELKKTVGASEVTVAGEEIIIRQ